MKLMIYIMEENKSGGLNYPCVILLFAKTNGLHC